jgi:predicted kinase
MLKCSARWLTRLVTNTQYPMTNIHSTSRKMDHIDGENETLPLLVIVSGAPATGKTTLGRQIAETFRLPFFHKDGIKEILFETLGWQDREWSKKLGLSSIYILYYLVEAQLRAGRSCVVESNFATELATQEFLALKLKYPFNSFQIICVSDPQIIAHRYRTRAESHERHSGHVDHVLADELDASALIFKHGPMALGGQVIIVNTSDFATTDFGGILQAIVNVSTAGASA